MAAALVMGLILLLDIHSLGSAFWPLACAVPVILGSAMALLRAQKVEAAPTPAPSVGVKKPP